MGTNYYLELKEQVCPTCGHDSSRDLHIGKSSAGWVFGWRGYRASEWESSPAGRDLTSPSEWFSYLAEQVEGGRVIRDEYGREHSLEEFRSWVLAKRRPNPNGAQPSSHRDVCPNDTEHVDGDDVLFHEFS